MNEKKRSINWMAAQDAKTEAEMAKQNAMKESKMFEQLQRVDNVDPKDIEDGIIRSWE